MSPVDELTEKQKAFAFIVAANPATSATQAYIQAGYGKASAGREAHKALKKPEIQAAIDHFKQSLAISEKHFNVTPEWITSRLAVEAVDGETASARVSALRTLADIHGMMSGSRADLPTELTALLAGVREGFRLGNSDNVGKQQAIEASSRVVEGPDGRDAGE